MTQFVYTGNKDVFDSTSHLVLERDEDGLVTKEVSVGESVSLTKEEVDGKLSAYNFEKEAEVSDEEKAELAASVSTSDSLTLPGDVDADIAVEAPLIDESVNNVASKGSSTPPVSSGSTSSSKSKN